jgi:hypothetical protein
MSDAIEKKAPPIAFLLECSDTELGNFELARLSEVANLRREMLARFDRIVDESALAVLAAWLRTIDRQELKRQLLQSPNAKIEEILARSREEIRNQGRGQEEAKEDGPMPSPWLVRQRKYLTDEERRAAHSAAQAAVSEQRIADGKCEKCSKPLDPNSVRECTKHLEMHRQRDARARQKKGIQPGMHGRQPGTLTALAASRDKRSLAVLAKWGIKPKHPPSVLNAVREALLQHMPDKANAMTQDQLFEQGVIAKTTGQKALAEMLEAGTIERIGAGSLREPYRYWRKVAD